MVLFFFYLDKEIQPNVLANIKEEIFEEEWLNSTNEGRLLQSHLLKKNLMVFKVILFEFFFFLDVPTQENNENLDNEIRSCKIQICLLLNNSFIVKVCYEIFYFNKRKRKLQLWLIFFFAKNQLK